MIVIMLADPPLSWSNVNKTSLINISLKSNAGECSCKLELKMNELYTVQGRSLLLLLSIQFDSIRFLEFDSPVGCFSLSG